MRALVALVAALELAQHLLAVRSFMATPAFWHYAVLVGMTENTLECCMLGDPALKGVLDIRMTGGTVRVGHLVIIGQGQRLVSLVTVDTVLEFLSFNMRIVTVETIGTGPVLFVAE